MATQALYRRYRPRRFSEVKGQEHVVRALRNAVEHGREGQAYLFSGPRGTGKTTSARILAKVLNCERPLEGEPCCECDSCVAVERGTSYDVHELDAASNNGVDAMRDLIEKASLGTPGRHKVYILDEVHMLSKAAEAALLKTLEEPPPHVVFVLATTDPQKVSDTIRSRTQHLQFHLLPADVLEEHVRWLASDAGIEVDDDALQSVLRSGGGSARDTISALELVAASGGIAPDSVPLDEFIEAFIEHDPGRALTVVAHATQLGRDPRILTEDIIRHLRDCFLSLMAPELVQLPAARAEEVSGQATRLGAAALVRAMERLGEMLVEMRHAPDPRLLLEVALVQLTHAAAGSDAGALAARIERLEQTVAAGVAAAPAAPPRPAPIDPNTGRAALGGRARRDGPVAVPSSAAPPPPAPAPVVAEAPSAPATLVAVPSPAEDPAPPAPAAPAPAPAAVVTPAATVTPTPAAAPSSASPTELWASQVVPSLKGFAKAVYSATKVAGEAPGELRIAVPSDVHRGKCEPHRADVEAALSKAVGSPMRVALVVDGTAHDDNVVPLKRPVMQPDEEIDLNELVDAPAEAVVTPLDRLHQAFPGSHEVDERT